MQVVSKPTAERFPLQRSSPPRRIGAEAGRALEILGHAIDYLTDDYIEAQGSLRNCGGQVEAIQLLMAINRSIFFSCPTQPGITEWFGALWNRMFQPASTPLSAPNRRF